jgi:predicted ATPase/class 3 adenylate cyclase
VTELPSGTVTFLFTDLVGSTRLWQEHPDAMRDALARHDEILRGAVEKRAGEVVKTTGDGLHAAFGTAPDAATAALDAQRAIVAEEWLLPEALQVRMGLHTGAAEVRDGDYYGTAVNRAARVMSTAHGGQVLASLASAELVRDAGLDGVELVDLGEHHLRDLARAEHLFQLVGSGLPSEFPPLRTLDAFPTNLPRQPTTFVGRTREVAEVVQLLGDSQVVTLTGVGGVGKTRLALQVAAEVLPIFRDGAWLVELAVVADPAAVPEAIATVLEVPTIPGKGVADAIVEDLRRRELLIVLDNCEHVLDAVASIVGEIGQRCPGVMVLATSREGLAVPGERIVAVPSLEVPAGDAPVDVAAESPAVQLFVDRAAAARRDLVLSTDNVESVVAVCRRLDGVPLALELAAARVGSLSPAQIAQRLDERFRLLTAGRRTAVERHQTLRATIDWSFNLLEPAERTALNRLAVFAGGCTLDAAEAVIGGDGIDPFDVIDLVARLVDQSLVVADDVDAEPRYRLLETIRQYAAEELAASDDLEPTLARHARHYRSMVEEIGPQLRGAEMPSALARYEAERENIRNALAWYVEHDDADGALTITLELHPLIVTETSLSMPALAALALETPTANTDPRYSALVTVAAWNLVEHGDLDAGLALLATVESAATRPGTPVEFVAALSRMRIAMAVGDLAGARAIVESMVEHTSDEHAFYIVWTLLPLASIFLVLGDRDLALSSARDALGLARRIGNPTAIAMALVLNAWLFREDEPGESRAMLQESLALSDAPTGIALGWAAPNLFVLDARAAAMGPCIENGRRAAAALERSHDTQQLGGAFSHLAVGFGALRRYETAGVLHGVADGQFPGASAVAQMYGLDVLQAEAEGAIGADRYEECRARGRAMDKDAAVDFLRAEVDALEAAERR